MLSTWSILKRFLSHLGWKNTGWNSSSNWNCIKILNLQFQNMVKIWWNRCRIELEFLRGKVKSKKWLPMTYLLVWTLFLNFFPTLWFKTIYLDFYRQVIVMKKRKPQHLIVIILMIMIECKLGKPKIRNTFRFGTP